MRLGYDDDGGVIWPSLENGPNFKAAIKSASSAAARCPNAMIDGVGFGWNVGKRPNAEK